MQGFASSSVYFTFATALVSITYPFSTHAHDRNNVKHDSSKDRGLGWTHKRNNVLSPDHPKSKQLQLTDNLQRQFSDIKTSKSGLKISGVNANDFGSLPLIPTYLKHYGITNSHHRLSSRDGHPDIVSDHIGKSTNSDLRSDRFVRSSYSIVVDDLLSKKRFDYRKENKKHQQQRESRSFRTLVDLVEFAEIYPHLKNTAIIPSSTTTSEQPNFILPVHHHRNGPTSVIPRSYAKDIRQLRRHLLSMQNVFTKNVLLSSSRNNPEKQLRVHFNPFYQGERMFEEENNNKGNSNVENSRFYSNSRYHNDDNSIDRGNGDDDVDKNYYNSDYMLNDASHNGDNGVDNNNNNNNDDGTSGGALSGNDDARRSAYDFHTSGKRGRKRKSRLMQYLRQRAGSVKAGKPLRLGVKTKASRLRRPQKPTLRKLQDEIVRRQPLRGPLTLLGYSESNKDDHDHSCQSKDGGSSTMPLTCPSNKNVCIYDSMICDGNRDCPDGADESFSMCVLRHWNKKLLHKIDTLAKKIESS